jgi:hypothetical protein
MMFKDWQVISRMSFFLLGSFVCSCSKNTGTIAPVTTPTILQVNVKLRHTLPAILKESSGLCYTDGQLWSFGDSGNPNSIYKIDTLTGAVLQTVTIANYPNIDWEDITADSSFIYVGDMGNNDGNRTNLRILKLKKEDIPQNNNAATVNAEAINFAYADQTDLSSNSNTNFDCEAIAAIGNHLYAFTKDRGDLQTRCYRLSKDPGTYKVSPLSVFNTNGKITAAAYNTETKELALLGYMNQNKYSFIWFFNGFAGDDFFNAAATRFTIGTATDWQTEGLDYISSGRLMVSCETSISNGASLYAVTKP